MNLKNLLLLLLLSSCWAPSFVFIKLGVDEMSPFTLAAGRITLGACFLGLIALVRGIKFPRPGKIWLHLFIAGFFAAALPFCLFGFGEQRISSALAGVINGTTPIMATLMAHLFIHDDRLNLSRFTGITLGLLGFLCLLVPHLMQGGLDGDAVGIMCIGIAASCYAIAMVYSRKHLRDIHPIAGSAVQLFITAAYMVPLALFTEGGLPSVSMQGFGAIAGLGILGTGCSFVLYYHVLRRTSVSYLALSNYLLPLYSTVLGAVFLGEHLGWNAYLAGGLILLGMMVVNGTVKLPLRWRAAQE